MDDIQIGDLILTEKLNNKDFAVALANIAVELNCTETTVIDLRGKSPATDFFVIATAASGRQGRSVLAKIEEFAKQNDIMVFGKAGMEHGSWIIIDFVDVVVHVFDPEYREYYQLENLWGDASVLEIHPGGS